MKSTSTRPNANYAPSSYRVAASPNLKRSSGNILKTSAIGGLATTTSISSSPAATPSLSSRGATKTTTTTPLLDAKTSPGLDGNHPLPGPTNESSGGDDGETLSSDGGDAQNSDALMRSWRFFSGHRKNAEAEPIPLLSGSTFTYYRLATDRNVYFRKTDFRDRLEKDEGVRKRKQDAVLTSQIVRNEFRTTLAGGIAKCIAPEIKSLRSSGGANRGVRGAQTSAVTDTVIGHHGIPKVTIKEDETIERNPSVKDTLHRSHRLLNRLWDELEVPHQQRHAFASQYFYPETAANFHVIASKIKELAMLRSTQKLIVKLIEQREAIVIRLKQVVPLLKLEDDSVAQRVAQSDMVNLIFKLREITCKIVLAIAQWRKSLCSPRQPFLFAGANYMYTMNHDLAFLQGSLLLRTLRTVAHRNPFLLPDRDPNYRTALLLNAAPPPEDDPHAYVEESHIALAGSAPSISHGSTSDSVIGIRVHGVVPNKSLSPAALAAYSRNYLKNRTGGVTIMAGMVGGDMDSRASSLLKSADLSSLASASPGKSTRTLSSPTIATMTTPSASSCKMRVCFPRDDGGVSSFPYGEGGTASTSSLASLSTNHSPMVHSSLSILHSMRQQQQQQQQQQRRPQTAGAEEHGGRGRIVSIVASADGGGEMETVGSWKQQPQSRPASALCISSAVGGAQNETTLTKESPKIVIRPNSTLAFRQKKPPIPKWKPPMRTTPVIDDYLKTRPPRAWSVPCSKHLLSHDHEAEIVMENQKYRFPFDVAVAASKPPMSIAMQAAKVVQHTLTPASLGNPHSATGGGGKKKDPSSPTQTSSASGGGSGGTSGGGHKTAAERKAGAAGAVSRAALMDAFMDDFRQRFVVPGKLPPTKEEMDETYRERSNREEVAKAVNVQHDEVGLEFMLQCEKILLAEPNEPLPLTPATSPQQQSHEEKMGQLTEALAQVGASPTSEENGSAAAQLLECPYLTELFPLLDRLRARKAEKKRLRKLMRMDEKKEKKKKPAREVGEGGNEAESGNENDEEDGEEEYDDDDDGPRHHHQNGEHWSEDEEDSDEAGGGVDGRRYTSATTNGVDVEVRNANGELTLDL